MAVTIPAPETQEFSMDISFEDGSSVKVTMEYPKDTALLALQAMQRMSDNTFVQGAMSVLRNDPSIKARMAEKGIAFADEDEEGYDEDE
jgi:hypothetical protein